jgi:hypothetical protein
MEPLNRDLPEFKCLANYISNTSESCLVTQGYELDQIYRIQRKGLQLKTMV